MKEFRFEPASQMITVEEGQNLNIDITGIKTAYRSVMYLIWFRFTSKNQNSCFYTTSVKFFVFIIIFQSSLKKVSLEKTKTGEVPRIIDLYVVLTAAMERCSH